MSNSSRLVSIITPSFNRADLYPETLASLKAQTYPHWEEIVVDDGSAADCLHQMRQLVCDEPRVTLLLRDREPKGACTCRNIGVERSRGDYLIFLDTDDLLAPHCLEQRVAVMEQHPELDLAIFPCEIFNKVPGDVGRWWNIDSDEDLLSRQFRMDVLCQGTGCIWRKDAFLDLGLWDESLLIWQDVDLFLRAYIRRLEIRICFDLPRDMFYRQHSLSLSANDYFSLPKLLSRIAVLKKNVTLLTQSSSSEIVRIAAPMARDIYSAAVRSGHFDLARNLINWAVGMGVITRAERIRLMSFANLHRVGITSIPWIGSILGKACFPRAKNPTLGQVAVSQPCAIGSPGGV